MCVHRIIYNNYGGRVRKYGEVGRNYDASSSSLLLYEILSHGIRLRNVQKKVARLQTRDSLSISQKKCEWKVMFFMHLLVRSSLSYFLLSISFY